MERPTRPILVVCPDFDEHSGGAIALHMLVHKLREQGVEAFAIPIPPKTYPKSMPIWLRWVKKLNQKRRKRRHRFLTHPTMNVPVGNASMAKTAIVVYPETIRGNPFGAPRVVRWLLHKPDFFGVPFEVSKDDLVFFYQDAFREGLSEIDDDNLLMVRWLRTDIYSNTGGTRSGSCRMKRKGSLVGMNAVPDIDESIPLDGLSHEQIADSFNKTDIFFCHDAYTIYLYYAALCGCVPVVVPENGTNGYDWRKNYALKWGVAYGCEEIEWAKKTRERLLQSVSEQQKSELIYLNRFLQKLYRRFG